MIGGGDNEKIARVSSPVAVTARCRHVIRADGDGLAMSARWWVGRRCLKKSSRLRETMGTKKMVYLISSAWSRRGKGLKRE